jgi:hypothetical protein
MKNRQKLLENSFVVPNAALADVPASLRGPAESIPGAAGSEGDGSVPRVPLVTASEPFFFTRGFSTPEER